MNELQEILKGVGLEDKEAKIYLSLLKFGSANVSDIADEAGIKRPTAYVILDELRKKGLVLKIPHAKKSIFQAKSPDEFYEQAVSHIDKLESVLPKLRSINPTKKGIKTLYFEGTEGLKEALGYKIKDLKDSVIDGFWAKNSGLPVTTFDIFEQWGKKLEKNLVSIEGVTPEHESTKIYAEKNKKLILAPLNDYSSDISIEATKNFIRIVDPHELKAIIIENPRVVEALKQIFALAKRNYTK